MNIKNINMIKRNLAKFICGVFVILSIFFLYICKDNKVAQYRSNELIQRTTLNGNQKRTDYVDHNGNVTMAVDLGYATVIETKTENKTKQAYYDAEGKPVKRYPGYYGRIRENNNRDFTIT